MKRSNRKRPWRKARRWIDFGLTTGFQHCRLTASLRPGPGRVDPGEACRRAQAALDGQLVEMEAQDHGDFTCQNCGGEFQKSRSDEEALEEMRHDIGRGLKPGDEKDLGVICDDCHHEFMAWFEQQSQGDLERMRANPFPPGAASVGS